MIGTPNTPPKSEIKSQNTAKPLFQTPEKATGKSKVTPRISRATKYARNKVLSLDSITHERCAKKQIKPQ